MTAPERILIVRPSALGDVCRTVPVVCSLRAAWPAARIDWIVQDSFLPAIAEHPALNEAIAFPRARFAALWRSPRVMRELWTWTQRLRDAKYDLVIDLQGLSRSGFITWSTHAPRRVGYRDARELGWLGCNERIAVPASLHAVDRMLALTEAVGAPPVRDLRLHTSAAARHWLERLRRRLSLRDGYAVLAPTARWSGKRWPAERWAELVGPLRERGFHRVLLIGAPSERDQVTECVPTGSLRRVTVNLVGRTSMAQTMALIAQSDLVVANDSAPLHMAVGFDRRLVGLFGPTDPRLVGPYQRLESVVRAPLSESEAKVSFKDDRAGDSIMRRISVADVLTCLDGELARRPLRPAPATTGAVAVTAPRAR